MNFQPEAYNAVQSLGLIASKTTFFFSFCLALSLRQRVALLERLVLAQFEGHKKIAGVEAHLIPQPGKSSIKTDVYRDAPVTVTVFFNARKVGTCEAFILSFFMSGGIMDIVQLQGVHGIFVPEELRDWPRRLVAGCQDFARATKARKVRIRRAQSLPSYPMGEGEDVRRRQERMRAHYDGTASHLHFSHSGDWYEWRSDGLPSAAAVSTYAQSLSTPAGRRG